MTGVRWASPGERSRDKRASPVLKEATRQLGRYFSGKLKRFDLPLAARGTDFQKRVWTTMREIPYGETATYGGMAMALGSGPRPIVLYAHGTQTNKALNLADITNTSNTEGALIAAMFAAQGYIVVAPNYAGYDISTLGYHPFLNAAQQSGEMIDALSAARTALPKTFAASTTDNGKLFVTGYSEGGHVAMATQRALQAAGATVTAAAPMSGLSTNTASRSRPQDAAAAAAELRTLSRAPIRPRSNS